MGWKGAASNRSMGRCVWRRSVNRHELYGSGCAISARPESTDPVVRSLALAVGAKG